VKSQPAFVNVLAVSIWTVVRPVPAALVIQPLVIMSQKQAVTVLREQFPIRPPVLLEPITLPALKQRNMMPFLSEPISPPT